MKLIESIKIKRYGEFEYYPLSSITRFIVIDAYEDVYQDERGTFAKTRLHVVAKIDKSHQQLLDEYGSTNALDNLRACQADIERKYNFEGWDGY